MSKVKSFSDSQMDGSETNSQDTFEQVIQLWKGFLSVTSLHGCTCIAQSQNHWLKRCFWIIAVLTSSSVLIFYVVGFYNVYQTHPYITKTGLQRLKSLPLPAISICNPGFKKDKVANADAMLDYILAHDGLVNEFGTFNFTTLSDKDVQSIHKQPYDDIGIPIEDLILKGRVNYRDIDIKKEFVGTPSETGHCFSFNKVNDNGTGGDIRLSMGDNLHLIFNISQDSYFPSITGAGVTLFLHEPTEEPSYVTKQVSLSPGHYTLIDLSLTKMKFLPNPFQSFGDNYCLESPEKMKLEWHSKYTWFGCVQECTIISAVKTCKCRPALRGIPASIAKNECDADTTMSCVYPTMTNTYLSALQENMTTCYCPHLCEYIEYDIRSSMFAFPHTFVSDFLHKKGVVASTQYLRDNYLAVDIRFESMIMNYVEHEPEYSAGHILSTLGGQMGLFLGASLLTLCELMETIFLTFTTIGKALFSSTMRASKK